MKKRIAFVTNPMTVGGVERALTALLKGMDYSRYEVVLWTKNAGGAFEKLVDPRVEIRYWDTGNSRKQLAEALRKGRLGRFCKGLYCRFLLRRTGQDWVRYEYYEAKAQRICDEEAYDAVIAYQGLYSGVLATALYRLKAPVKIAWIHGEQSFTRRQAAFLSKEYRRFHRLFCVSESIREQFCTAFPDVSDRTSVFYNLTDAGDIRKRALEKMDIVFHRPAVLTVGRISKPKGQILIPKAVRILLDEGYDIYWYLVGDGEMRQTLEAEIEKYGVQDRVVLLGTKRNPYPYIQGCDIYVQPSFSEGYCTATVEAKILGKPVVTTDAPGMREQFVSGENGLIVDAMTPEAIGDGVRRLLDRPELREKFAGALKEEAFDRSAQLQILYNFMES